MPFDPEQQLPRLTFDVSNLFNDIVFFVDYCRHGAG